MDGSLRALPGAEMETEVAEEPRRFEDFFGSEHARLFGALCLVTGDRHEAEEIMQDAFLRLWERWDRVRGLDDPTAYLFRTAMNVFRNRYRRAALSVRKTLSLAPSEEAGTMLGMRASTVRTLATRARAAIREKAGELT